MAPERGLPEDVYALPAVSVAPAAIAARRARAPAGLLRKGDGHLERPAVHLGAVHLPDGFGRLLVARKLDETEAPALARVAVGDDRDRRDGSELRKRFLERVFRCGERQIPDVQFPTHRTSFRHL